MTIDDVVRNFEKGFSNWDITLPPELVEAREAGLIVSGGWTIFYKFGFEGEREYMDYYASHRMTNDSHVRLYADGTSRGLPSYRGEWILGETERDSELLEKEFYSYNQAVGELLAEKGFTSSHAHASHNVNSWLMRTPPDEQGDSESSG